MKNIRNIKKQTKHDEIEPIVISANKTVIGKGILTFKWKKRHFNFKSQRISQYQTKELLNRSRNWKDYS